MKLLTAPVISRFCPLCVANRRIFIFRLLLQCCDNFRLLLGNFCPQYRERNILIGINFTTLNPSPQKSRDPSPLLPFWDKCRNLLRGSFELRSEVFVMKALGEREPLNNSEYLSICSTGFTFKWTNGNFPIYHVAYHLHGK